MASASDLIDSLLKRQNIDGGWSHQGKSSWTEPTALAVLALNACQVHLDAAKRGRSWLVTQQRPDGGWAPTSAVETSTAVTSTAYLALSGSASQSKQRKAIGWIMQQVKPDLGLIARIEYRLQQMPPEESVMGGSPWYPGTAAWISPTVMSVLALADAKRASISPPEDLALQIARGRRYLLSRQCSGGGWNHGGTQYRSATAEAYPEMTGMALLALDGEPLSKMKDSLQLAERMALTPGSSEARSWLMLGLAKHKLIPPAESTAFEPRTTREICLQLLALSTESAHNSLLASTV